MDETCTATFAACHCNNTNCLGIHVCKCRGSWSGEPGTVTFEVLELPGRMSLGDALMLLLLEGRRA